MKALLHWLRGTRIIAAWIAAGAPMVSQQQAEFRSTSCLQCEFNRRQRGLKLLGRIVMGTANYRAQWRIENRLDDKLKVCAVCDCPLPHKVRMPIGDVAKGIDFAGGELLKFPVWCWIRKELVK